MAKSPAQELKQVLLWGALAAAAGLLRFEVLGFGHIAQDPREIFTLVGLLFLTRAWSVVLLGVLAVAPTPFGDGFAAFLNSAVSHAVVLVVVWALYRRWLRGRPAGPGLALGWAGLVVAAYDLGFFGIFLLRRFVEGDRRLDPGVVAETFARFHVEVVVTLVITTLCVLLLHLHRERLAEREDRLAALRREMDQREQAQEARRQMQRLQRMDALGRLAGGVAHDFNNLLTVITGHASLAREGLGEDDPVRTDLQRILEAGAKGAELTRRLLTFSRSQRRQPGPCEVGAVVKGMEPMLHRLLDADIEFRVQVEEGLPLVEADGGELEQVLMNLVLNARDAVSAGPAPRRIVLTARPAVGDGGGVELSVQDNGEGMVPEQQERIFEPFFTTKPVGKGTGLGLSTVYGIVTEAGGSVAVRSSPGAGTTMLLHWPAAPEGISPSASPGLPPATSPAAPDAPPDGPTARRTLLP